MAMKFPITKQAGGKTRSQGWSAVSSLSFRLMVAKSVWTWYLGERSIPQGQKPDWTEGNCDSDPTHCLLYYLLLDKVFSQCTFCLTLNIILITGICPTETNRCHYMFFFSLLILSLIVYKVALIPKHMMECHLCNLNLLLKCQKGNSWRPDHVHFKPVLIDGLVKFFFLFSLHVTVVISYRSSGFEFSRMHLLQFMFFFHKRRRIYFHKVKNVQSDTWGMRCTCSSKSALQMIENSHLNSFEMETKYLKDIQISKLGLCTETTFTLLETCWQPQESETSASQCKYSGAWSCGVFIHTLHC